MRNFKIRRAKQSSKTLHETGLNQIEHFRPTFYKTNDVSSLGWSSRLRRIHSNFTTGYIDLTFFLQSSSLLLPCYQRFFLIFFFSQSGEHASRLSRSSPMRRRKKSRKTSGTRVYSFRKLSNQSQNKHQHIQFPNA